MFSERLEYKYTKLPEITTMAFVANVKNCVNLDIDPELTAEQEERYRKCITNSYQCANIDAVTLEEGEITTRRTFRARLKGIAMTKSKKASSGITSATNEVNNWRMRTSGMFICRISDIEIYERVLVELIDPVTGQSLNQHILNKYPQFLENYRTRTSHPVLPTRPGQ